MFIFSGRKCTEGRTGAAGKRREGLFLEREPDGEPWDSEDRGPTEHFQNLPSVGSALLEAPLGGLSSPGQEGLQVKMSFPGLEGSQLEVSSPGLEGPQLAAGSPREYSGRSTASQNISPGKRKPSRPSMLAAGPGDDAATVHDVEMLSPDGTATDASQSARGRMFGPVDPWLPKHSGGRESLDQGTCGSKKN